jgi:hypothetical protein
MSHEEDIDARLSRLARATERVRPRADFSSRVMLSIGAEQGFALSSLRTPASRFLPFGMLAAALALVWAVSVNNQVNEAVASSDDTELSW